MSVKRPSFALPEATRVRVIELRLAGKTEREIAAECEIAKSTVGEICKSDPRIAAAKARLGGLTATVALEDADLADDYRATAKIALAGIAAQARVLKRQAKEGAADPRALVALAKAMDSAMKWRQLLVGRPTSHAKTERAPQPAQELTPEEKKLLELAELAEGVG